MTSWHKHSMMQYDKRPFKTVKYIFEMNHFDAYHFLHIFIVGLQNNVLFRRSNTMFFILTQHTFWPYRDYSLCLSVCPLHEACSHDKIIYPGIFRLLLNMGLTDRDYEVI